MSLVATIDVALRGQTGDLDKKLDQSGKKVQGFGESVKAAASSVAAGLAGIVARTASALGGLAVPVLSQISYLSDLEMTATRLGVTTGTLAGFHHAAALTGQSMEDFNNSFNKFQQLISQGGMGEGGAIRAMNQLGLNMQELKDLAPEQALFRVADAIKDTGNSADKIRLIGEVLGKGAERWLPLFSKGSEEIRRLIDESAALGPTSSANARLAAQATLAWRELQGVMTGVFRSLAVSLAPVITSVARALDEPLRQFATWVRSAEGLEEIGRTLRWVSITITNIGRAVRETIDGFNLWNGALTPAGTTLGKFLHIIFQIQVVAQNLDAVFGLVLTNIVSLVFAAVNKIIGALNKIPGVNIDLIERTDIPAKDRLKRFFDNELKKKLIDFNQQIVDFGGGAFGAAFPDKPPAKGKEIEALWGRPAAMEAGSREAFSTLFGTMDQQKKAYATANEQLKVLKGVDKKMEQLVRKQFGIKKANL